MLFYFFIYKVYIFSYFDGCIITENKYFYLNLYFLSCVVFHPGTPMETDVEPTSTSNADEVEAPEEEYFDTVEEQCNQFFFLISKLLSFYVCMNGNCCST